MPPCSIAVLLAGIAIRYVPHAMALIAVAHVIAGASHPFWPVAWLFLGAPLVESLLGEESGPRSGRGHAARLASRLAPWLWVPVQASLFVAGLSIAREAFDPVTAAITAVPTGMMSGIFGMAAAHELMHRRGVARSVAALMLASWGYGHFLIEHVHGHHRRVGTFADPATARLGENLYVFLPRTLKGTWVDAWHLETIRLARHGRRVCCPQNRLIVLGVLSIALCVAACLVAGLPGAVFFVVHGAVVVSILETVNYVQHYGLERRSVRDPIAAHHTWNCTSRLTNLLLFDLGRHADHHLASTLQAFDRDPPSDAPRLPSGYFTMFVVALLPPLWTQIMDPRATLVRKRVACGLTPLPARNLGKGVP